VVCTSQSQSPSAGTWLHVTHSKRNDDELPREGCKDILYIASTARCRLCPKGTCLMPKMIQVGEKWDMTHRNLVKLYSLLFSGGVVDRLEDSKQLIVNKCACTDDETTICCFLSFLLKEDVVSVSPRIKQTRETRRIMARRWASTVRHSAHSHSQSRKRTDFERATVCNEHCTH